MLSNCIFHHRWPYCSGSKQVNCIQIFWAYCTCKLPREGGIIKCPLNNLFHNLVTIILTMRMAVIEIPNQKSRHSIKMTIMIMKCQDLLLKCQCRLRLNVIKISVRIANCHLWSMITPYLANCTKFVFVIKPSSHFPGQSILRYAIFSWAPRKKNMI